MGLTLIISPLLALMRNQLSAAGRLGIRAETVNSSNREEWEGIEEEVLADKVDALLVSPERLANERFLEDCLRPIADRIGLLVVDEAHCISDWGHDFRPDYRRLVGVLQQLPPNMPVLGTTATANDRVIRDVQEQLGTIEIRRGSLARKTLSLFTKRLPDRAARLSWLAQLISVLPGTGIVYVLTKQAAETVAAWLRECGIDARAYYSDVKNWKFKDSARYRLYLEDLLLQNKLKTLVATSALGMGYDKPDLSFVIHYQSPSSVISYYQQVGRAGRAIDRALGVLLSGIEDSDIHEYFRLSAFPDEEHVESILRTLERSDGLSSRELQQYLNLQNRQIEKALKWMSVENPAPVTRQGSKWYRTPVTFQMDHERIAHLTGQREAEWQEMQSYIDSETCLMEFLRNALDDPASVECGHCAVCWGQKLSGESGDKSLVMAAARFLRRSEYPWKPRQLVPVGGLKNYDLSGDLRRQQLMANEGRILSHWKDGGWGDMVAIDKQAGRFRDELVEAAAEMYEKRWQPEPPPQWATFVSSHRQPDLVAGFARRLAKRLNLQDLRFLNVIRKVRNNDQQKNQQNSFHQCRNLDGAFAISGRVPGTPVLLIDDVIDSGWTMTVLAAMLRQAGSGPVFPIALASSSKGE